MPLMIALMLLQTDPPANWAIERRPAGCIVEAPYDDGPVPAVGLESSIVNADLMLSVSARVASLPPGWGNIPVTIGPAGKTVSLPYHEHPVPDDSSRTIDIRVDRATITAIAAAQSIVVGDAKLTIDTHDLAQAVKAIDACTASLKAD